MFNRTFVIGDIHGCRTALETLCNSLELQPDDLVILLGDVVDRGPDSRGAIEYLLDLQGTCQMVLIKGNHEEMMLNALDSRDSFHRWMMVGGREAMDSYQNRIDNIPPQHRKFLESSRDYYETPAEIFVHANLEPGVVLEKQTPRWLRWQHLTGLEYPHESGKRVICGHTIQREGLPYAHEGWVCLDTGAYRGNPLTCLEVETDIVHRADEEGTLFASEPLEELAVTSG
jgi:serine/threonine protein phosphatase 1